jgi:hypothetical protein
MENNKDTTYNWATPEEATNLLQGEKIKILGDEVVFYVQHVEEVDQKPEQLIGVESDEDVIAELDRMYLPVVAVGSAVENIKVGDLIYATYRVITSTEHFTVKDLKFQTVSARNVKIVKEA